MTGLPILGCQPGKKIMDCRVIRVVNSTNCGPMAWIWLLAAEMAKVGKASKAVQSPIGMEVVGMFGLKVDKMASKEAIPSRCPIAVVC